MERILKWIAGCLLSVACLTTFGVPVTANGAPIKVFLNYLPDISTVGPTEASGMALISIGEAWVEIQVDGLPQLDGEHYEAWAVSSDDGQMISLGTFNADSNEKVDYFSELGELPYIDYRLFVITIEPDSDPSPEPDQRWTVAGFFPNPKLIIVSGTPTPTLEPGVIATAGAPTTLPVTGHGDSSFLWLGLGLLGLVWTTIGMILVSYRKREAQ